jgi:ABC-2 type transport system permease protein
MKAVDIALKDLSRSFRSAFAVMFMFGIPLLVTGMFYFMFGNIASGGDFNLPKTKVVIANLDEGGPKFQVNTKNIPGGKDAHTMGQLIVGILQSEDLSKLIEVTLVPDADSARAAVDRQAAQVALIIPSDFSKQFADVNGKAVIEFYQDPTLTIGPSIIRSILNRFMDGMSGVKIAVNVFLDEADPKDDGLAGQVVQEYLHNSLTQTEDPEKALLDVRSPTSVPVDPATETTNLLLRIVGPIMAGMMVFYAFYTGTSTAQSILKEEEERTLPRLFTTPTSQAIILTGKFLSVFITVLVQIIVLLIAGNLIFGIRWGEYLPVALIAAGTVLSASSFGIFVNSFLKSTRQGGAVFGGVLTVTGMLGMISLFATGSPSAAQLGDTVSLMVPQGWAVHGLQQAMNGQPLTSVLITFLVMLVWSVVFFFVGVLRFNKRYA